MDQTLTASGITAAVQGAHDKAVGAHIRALRKRKHVSLQTLSAASGLSIGYLSQIERGISSASIRALALITDGLGSGLDAIFLPATGAPARTDAFAFRVAERRGLGFWRDGIEKELLTPGEGHALNLYMVHIAPGGVSGTSEYVHAGEEAGFILTGELLLCVDGQEMTLLEGDAFRFKSHRPHRFSNQGAAPCVVLWILAPGG